ncbi:ABC transporter ATP-binding protein [uncultured Modestobacter sp.]|uniref:ABC transporter ATP-binding protein n=1 Tax=uncultured Modestobacter sp. TaxID=380048 RepID=UPI00261744F1|nr:ATP-binding cassette domain-containing protein [uncultured Modestobacter sp.]
MSIRVDDLTFHYPASDLPALDGVTFQVDHGQVVGLVGPPGSGKTTLCLALAGLVPGVTGGRLSGRVELTAEDDATDGDAPVGIVFEDPGGQLTQLRVLSEVADPLRTRGRTPEDAEAEARRLLERVGLPGEELARRWVWELSEGQQVLLALAATLAIRPRVLVLDTVMGHLDPGHRGELLRIIREEAGRRTVLLVEQDAGVLVDLADRLLVLTDGAVSAQGDLQELLADERVQQAADLDPPAPLHAARRLGLPGRPLTDVQFGAAVGRIGADHPGARPPATGSPKGRAEPAWAGEPARIQVREVDFAYPDRSPALRGVSLEVRPGEVHAVMGPTGAGKSTLVKLLAGLLRPVAGQVVVDDQDTADVHPADLALRVATLPQGAAQTLSQRRVRDEIAYSLRRRRRTEELDARVDIARRLVGLPQDLLDADPILLPNAHRRLVALAAALVVEPTVVVLDAPFSGMGPGARRRLTATMSELRDRGTTVLMTEHDAEAVAEVADTVTVLDHGAVALQGPTRDVFGARHHEQLGLRRLALPRAGALARTIGLEACTLDDLVGLLAGAPSTPAPNGATPSRPDAGSAV